MDTYSGAILAFFLRPSDAERIAMPNGEEPAQLHLTLGFLGDSTDIPPEVQESLIDYTQFVAPYYPPIHAKVAGFGRFMGLPNERDCLYAAIDAPELAGWRQRLIAGFDNIWPVSREHGFTPHITLQYLEHFAPNPLNVIDPTPLYFDTLTLALGGVHHSFVLRG